MKNIIRSLIPNNVRENYHKLQTKVRDIERQVKSLNHEMEYNLAILQKHIRFQPDETVGMNGQLQRKQVIERLFNICQFQTVIETGTYYGETAGYLNARFNVPVSTCDSNPKANKVAANLLRSLEGVELHVDDSRSFLRKLANDHHRTAQKTFFYLDAHWNEDLPLADEVCIIATHWVDYVILIDDFEVGGDPGYGFDDYGPGKSLKLSLVNDALERYGLSAFSPSIASANETGAKRGYLVVSKQGTLEEIADGCHLRPAAPAEAGSL